MAFRAAVAAAALFAYGLAGACCADTPILDWLSQHPQRVAANQSYLDTDGPSFTRANSTVPQGMVLLEDRYTYTSPGMNNLPQMDLRFGVSSRLELRAEWGGVNLGPGLQSSQSLEVGFKYLVSKGKGLIPKSALMVELFTPTGYGPGTMRSVAPEVDYLYGWSLNDKLMLECSTGAIFGQPSAPSVTQYYQSAMFSRTWRQQHLVTFAEAYSLFGNGSSPGAVLPSLDTGALWRPGYNFQIDWRVGMGLNRTAAPFFTGGGVSFRY
ncbi:MAG TPA: transporter [Pirellulales bacterium]|jgi:hypothetical protein|nr:transporter [Pirellulales bacterium]